jgi:ribosomal protein L11 methyltransferase
LHGTLPIAQTKTISAPNQKKSLKYILLGLFLMLLLVFGEHLSRNSLLPALAPRVDGTSSWLAVQTFSVLNRIDQKLCMALGCINRPVSDFSAWKITSVTLSPENAREGLKNASNQSVLEVEIQNRLAIAVLIPNLEISLTDAEESELKSIQLTPKEWLPAAWQKANPEFLQKGALSGELISAQLPISLPANAAGYRVRVLYPQ